MSVLVVGLSHKSAPVSTLERAAVSGDTLAKLLHDVARLPDIAETFVISTCNRVEVYAEVGRFHGGVAGVCDLLSRYSGIPAAELTSSLYVHYEDRAVQHLLAVSSGLESMVVGEDQILGQVRTALKVAGDNGTLGRSLRDLGRLALRTGKRARAETGIDRLGLSLVSVGIELAAPPLREKQEKLGSNGPGRLSGLHVLVVGAGAMSGLAVATAAREGAARVTVANRTRARAERLAAGVGGAVADFADLAPAIAAADLVISCTGAANLVITESVVRAVLAIRDPARPLVLLDLAMPRDVDPAVAGLPGPAEAAVIVISMDTLRGSGETRRRGGRGGRGPRNRRGRVRRLRLRRPRRPGDADRGGAAREGGDGRRRRARPAGRAAVGGERERSRAGRNSPDGPPSGRQAVACAHCAGKRTRVVAGRGRVRGRAAGALRS